jgi:hypothetical protein
MKFFVSLQLLFLLIFKEKHNETQNFAWSWYLFAVWMQQADGTCFSDVGNGQKWR